MAGTEFTSAKVSPQFLRANATSHTWPFSAVAELIDNAYDPDVSASEICIDMEVINGKTCLVFTDNGAGMDLDHLERMLSFGYCEKDMYSKQGKTHRPIGRYGNGFKSGSMRLAKDALVFTVHKKSGTASIGLLSLTFLEDRQANSVLIPMVEYTRRRLGFERRPDSDQIEAILEVSPYKDEDELKAELLSLLRQQRTSSGTKIVLFGLKRCKNGLLELDFKSDPLDIRYPETLTEDKTAIASSHRPLNQYEYRQSLRTYCSILFMKPRIKIFIRGKKVRSRYILGSLSKKKTKRYKPSKGNADARSISITFGFSPSRGDGKMEDYGVMLYHNNRLIKPYAKLGYQSQPNDLGVGIVGLVDVTDLMTPTHNKQDFENTQEFRSTITSLSSKLNQYWDEIMKGQADEQQVDDSSEKPWTWVRCDNCLQWRRLPVFAQSKPLPEDWFCHMNPDPSRNRCEIPEEEPSDDEEGPTKTTKQVGTAKKAGRGNGKSPPAASAAAATTSSDASEFIASPGSSGLPGRGRGKKPATTSPRSTAGRSDHCDEGQGLQISSTLFGSTAVGRTPQKRPSDQAQAPGTPGTKAKPTSKKRPSDHAPGTAGTKPKLLRVDTAIHAPSTSANSSNSAPGSAREQVASTLFVQPSASKEAASTRQTILTPSTSSPAKGEKNLWSAQSVKLKRTQLQLEQFKRNVHKLLSHVVMYIDPAIDPYLRFDPFMEVGAEEEIVDTVEKLMDDLGLQRSVLDEGDLSDSRVEERSAAETSVSKEYGIPEAPPPPVDRQLLDFTDVTEVFFDIETTGLQRGSNITQIAAIRDDGNFNVFVMPEVPTASPIKGRRGIRAQGDQLVGEDNRRLHALSLQTALEELCAFLEQSSNNVLVGHNIQTFDRSFLFRALESCSLLERFCGLVVGFMDTRSAFKQTHQNLESYSQQQLVRNILGRDYKEHDAEADALALKQLVQHVKIPLEIKREASFSTQYAVDCFQKNARVETNMPGLENLVTTNIISRSMARKIACSGLTAEHLGEVYRKYGKEGIKNVFTEKVQGNARITANNRVITAIANYFALVQSG